MFGLSSKSRFLCIDIQFDEVYFVVVHKVGAFFEIDLNEKAFIEGGVFDGLRVRMPGKIADVLEGIKKKFGVLSVYMSVPENFCYSALLPSEAHLTSSDIRRTICSHGQTSSYIWTHSFQREHSVHTVLHTAQKQVCDTLYSLMKTLGFTAVNMYPRALVFGELQGLKGGVACDFGKNQTTLFSGYEGHIMGFSVVPYGIEYILEKVQTRFSLGQKEAKEVLDAYGTEVLPRKEGHMVEGIMHTFLAPIVDEINSLELRRQEYKLRPSVGVLVCGFGAQYEGVVEDVARVMRMKVTTLEVWEGVIDLSAYIPGIHKNESFTYAGVAGLMNIIKRGTQYEPFVDR